MLNDKLVPPDLALFGKELGVQAQSLFLFKQSCEYVRACFFVLRIIRLIDYSWQAVLMSRRLGRSSDVLLEHFVADLPDLGQSVDFVIVG